MTRTIQAVVFDFGGVLTLTPGPRHWSALLEAVGAGNGGSRLAALHSRYHAHRDGFDRGELSARDYWTAVVQQLGTAPEPPLLDRLFELDTAAWTRIRVEVVRWAARLRGSGYRTGILSNMPSEVLESIERSMGWIGEFAPRLYSCRLGLIKPDAAIYRALLAQLSAPPRAVLFLDDRDENVQAARELGMAAERFESLEQILPVVRQRYGLPDHETAAERGGAED